MQIELQKAEGSGRNCFKSAEAAFKFCQAVGGAIKGFRAKQRKISEQNNITNSHKLRVKSKAKENEELDDAKSSKTRRKVRTLSVAIKSSEKRAKHEKGRKNY